MPPTLEPTPVSPSYSNESLTSAQFSQHFANATPTPAPTVLGSDASVLAAVTHIHPVFPWVGHELRY